MVAPGASQTSDLEAWAAWVRSSYVIDGTGEQLLRMILEAGSRYQQARALLDLEGLTLANGRPHPALAVERETRAAIARLITQLDLEDVNAPPTAAATSPVERLRRVR